jgi:DNA mismatch repair protein MutS2
LTRSYNPRVPADIESQEALDFPRVLSHLADHARTLCGKDAALSHPLATTVEEVEALHNACREFKQVVEAGADPPLSGLEDIRSHLGLLHRGGTLETEDLWAVRGVVLAFHRLDAWLAGQPECPQLQVLGQDLQLDPSLRSCLEPALEEGALSAICFPRLGELRREIQATEARIRSTLDDLVRGEALSDVIQDRYATQRGDRWVIPIRASAKRSGLGIVHDTSRSGETVFIEPQAVVELNNQRKLAEGALLREERRILVDLSRQIAPFSDAMEAAHQGGVALDLAWARYRLGEALGGTPLATGSDGVLSLKNARHPLLVLSGEAVVANDLSLDSAHPALVLSGPNAGGKTIAMKTLGLAGLMVRAGIPFPAAEGSRVDVFPHIIAVLGDAQTVEKGLSTFSAHILAVSDALARSEHGTLVLLDELASGTDPVQGAALAQALMEAMVDAGAKVAATTHFPELKNLLDPRFRNAAMQFGEDGPTYRVEWDKTGLSHAFAIAQKFGLPGHVLERSRALLGTEQAARIDSMAWIEKERTRLADLETTLQQRKEEQEFEHARLKRREEKLEHREQQALDTSIAETLERIQSLEAEAVGLIGALQANPNLARAGSTLEEIRALKSEVRPPPTPTPAVEFEVSVGDRVRHRTLGTVGEVVALPKSGRVEIRLGSLKTLVDRLDLLPMSQPPAPPEPQAPLPSTSAPKLDGVRTPSNTLDLRGFRVEEALLATEKFLDQLLLQDTPAAFLLHGHGTGALKQALRDHLTRSSRAWRALEEGEGGDAFTVVVP